MIRACENSEESKCDVRGKAVGYCAWEAEAEACE